MARTQATIKKATAAAKAATADGTRAVAAGKAPRGGVAEQQQRPVSAGKAPVSRAAIAASAGKKPVAIGENGPIVPHKKRRFRPGTKALREIRRYQKSFEPLIPKLPFNRLVREIAQDLVQVGVDGFRFSAAAIEALQAAAESYLVDLLSETLYAAIHAHRITISDKDINLVTTVKALSGDAMALKLRDVRNRSIQLTDVDRQLKEENVKKYRAAQIKKAEDAAVKQALADVDDDLDLVVE